MNIKKLWHEFFGHSYDVWTGYCTCGKRIGFFIRDIDTYRYKTRREKYKK